MLSPCPSVSPEHDERGISYARPVGFDPRHVLQRMQDIASMQQCVQKHSPSPATYAVRSAAHVDPSPGALDAMAAASRRIQQHIKEKAEATPRGPSRSPSVAGSGDHEGSGRPYVATTQALPSPRTQERAREALKALTKERRASQDTAAQRKEELFRQRDERLRQFTAVSGVSRPPSPSPSEQLKGATSIKVATIDLGRVLSESAGKQQTFGSGIAKIITKPHRSGSMTSRLGHNNKENDARLR